jgi:hypothetical protein
LILSSICCKIVSDAFSVAIVELPNMIRSCVFITLVETKMWSPVLCHRDWPHQRGIEKHIFRLLSDSSSWRPHILYRVLVKRSLLYTWRGTALGSSLLHLCMWLQKWKVHRTELLSNSSGTSWIPANEWRRNHSIQACGSSNQFERQIERPISCSCRIVVLLFISLRSDVALNRNSLKNIIYYPINTSPYYQKLIVVTWYLK